MHKHTVKQSGPNGPFELKRDGYDCRCPKTAVLVPVQTQTGGVVPQPSQFNCSTACPLASVITGSKDGEVRVYYITECTGRTLEYDLPDGIELYEKKPTILGGFGRA